MKINVKAFDGYIHRYAPEPKKSPIDYSNPTVCPYCKEPMVLSKIRTANGTEQVYLCRSDRAVGVVPDANAITSSVLAEQVDDIDPASTTTKIATDAIPPQEVQPFGPGTEVSFASNEGSDWKVVKYIPSRFGVPDFYVLHSSNGTKSIKASLVRKAK